MGSEMCIRDRTSVNTGAVFDESAFLLSETVPNKRSALVFLKFTSNLQTPDATILKVVAAGSAKNIASRHRFEPLPAFLGRTGVTRS